ncbi:unnamed protein product, partial [Prorocentrum cordatum]
AIFFLFSERRNYQRQLARQKWHAQPTEPPVASGRCRDKLSKSSGSTRREGKAEEAHFFSERRNDQRQLAPHKWHAQPTESLVASGRCGDKLSKSVGAHSREGKAEEAHFFSERRNDQRHWHGRSGTPSQPSRRSPAANAGTSCLNQWVHTAGRARQKRRTSSLNAEMTSGSWPRISAGRARQKRRTSSLNAEMTSGS